MSGFGNFATLMDRNTATRGSMVRVVTPWTCLDSLGRQYTFERGMVFMVEGINRQKFGKTSRTVLRRTVNTGYAEIPATQCIIGY